jgi:hypothetical protein
MTTSLDFALTRTGVLTLQSSPLRLRAVVSVTRSVRSVRRPMDPKSARRKSLAPLKSDGTSGTGSDLPNSPALTSITANSGNTDAAGTIGNNHLVTAS